MKFNLPWIIDPKTGEASVSLTNFMISVAALLVAIGLNLAGKTKDTSSAVEYFSVSSALYFGRRLNIGGKEFSSSQESNNNDKT